MEVGRREDGRRELGKRKKPFFFFFHTKKIFGVGFNHGEGKDKRLHRTEFSGTMMIFSFRFATRDFRK